MSDDPRHTRALTQVATAMAWRFLSPLGRRLRQAVEVFQSPELRVRDVQAENVVNGTQIIIHPPDHDTQDTVALHRALDSYLLWLASSTGRVVLRGIKRGGQQAVELALDTIYVPLQAEALPDAEQVLRRNLRRSTGQAADGADVQAAELLEAVVSATPISMRELLAQGQRVAVIGAPGYSVGAEAEWEKAAAWDAQTQRKRVYAWGDLWDKNKANVDSRRYLDYPYQNDNRHDPEGETQRTLRGGAWHYDARSARASYRGVYHPAVFDDDVGLRVAVAPVLLQSGS